jgi:uncharacterized protein
MADDEPSFEWNATKNQSNVVKHGLAFEIAQKAFLDKARIILEDLEHSTEAETRYFCIGKVDDEVVTVRFTWRSNKIRIFGAGYWRKGKQIYEKENG